MLSSVFTRSDYHNSNPLDQNWPCTVKNNHDWQLGTWYYIWLHKLYCCIMATMLLMYFRWQTLHAVTSVRTATCWTWQHQTITSGTWWSQVTDGFTLYGVWLWNRGMGFSTNNIEPMHMTNGYSLNNTALYCWKTRIIGLNNLSISSIKVHCIWAESRRIKLSGSSLSSKCLFNLCHGCVTYEDVFILKIACLFLSFKLIIWPFVVVNSAAFPTR